MTQEAYKQYGFSGRKLAYFFPDDTEECPGTKNDDEQLPDAQPFHAKSDALKKFCEKFITERRELLESFARKIIRQRNCRQPLISTDDMVQEALLAITKKIYCNLDEPSFIEKFYDEVKSFEV